MQAHHLSNEHWGKARHSERRQAIMDGYIVVTLDSESENGVKRVGTASIGEQYHHDVVCASASFRMGTKPNANAMHIESILK